MVNTIKKSICSNHIFNLAFAAIIALLFIEIPVELGISIQAKEYIGLLIAMVFMLITGVFDEHIVILLVLSVCVILNIAPFSTVFSAFSGTTMWMVLTILPITVVIKKSGLMNRIALYLLKLFPCSYKWQLLALSLSSMVLNPLIPSTTAKSGLLASLTASVAEKMSLEKKSKPLTGLFLAVFINGPSLGHIFLSGSVQALLVVGMMPEKIADNFSWTGWFIASLVWAIAAFILVYIVLLILYSPKESIGLTKSALNSMINDLGPMSQTEKITGILMVFTLIGWITKNYTGIPECIFAIIVYAFLHTVGAISNQEFRSEIPWDIWIYVGGIVCIASLFTVLEIDVWLAAVMEPIVRLITHNAIIYLIGLVIIVYLFRIFIVSSIATVTIFYVVFASTAYNLLGISPFITGFLIIAASKSWPTEYTNTNFVTAQAIMGKDAVDFKEAQRMSHVFIAITILAAIISIPYWKIIGLM